MESIGIFDKILKALGPELAAEYLTEVMRYRANHNDLVVLDEPIETIRCLLDNLEFKDVEDALFGGFMWSTSYRGSSYWIDVTGNITE